VSRSIGILGGGLAGIAAAVALAQEGFPVTLIERRATLGGRASAFQSDGVWVDNCQHVILGCCTNLLHLLNDLKTSHLIRFYDSIPFYANGKTTLIKPSFLPSPFHFMPSFLKAPLFSWKEKLSILRLMGKLLKHAPNPEDLDKLTMLEWLKTEGQPEGAIEKFWSLVLVSTLNETLDRASAKYGVMFIQEAFLRDRVSASFGVPEVSLAELYHVGAETLLNQYKVRRIQATANAVAFESNRSKVFLDKDEPLEFDDLISAIPFYNLIPILPPQIRENRFFSRVNSLETSPILGIHYWFKKPLTQNRFGAFPLSPIHWFFTHPSRGESFYVELVVSASRALMDSSNDSLVQLGLKELSEYFPNAVASYLIKSIVVRETRATFSIKPGSDAFRPGQATPIPGFYLAGDWTDTGWPATMEGAVRSGYRAAELVMSQSGRSKAVLQREVSALSRNKVHHAN